MLPSLNKGPSQPDGKLAAIVQKQCRRLMTDAQAARWRRQQAAVWTEEGRPRSDVSCAALPHDWESLLSPPGAPVGFLTHILQLVSAPADTGTCDFSIGELAELRRGAADGF